MTVLLSRFSWFHGRVGPAPAQLCYNALILFSLSLNRVATFERGNGDIVENSYDMIVGADGCNSRVRKNLEENVQDFTVRQRKVT